MRLKSHREAGMFVVSRGRGVVFLVRAAVAGSCGGAGATFLRVDPASTPASVAGWIFLGLSGLMGVTALQRVVTGDGEVRLRVSMRGIDVSAAVGQLATHYPWDHVVRVVLAESLRTIKSDEASRERRCVIVYLDPERYGDESLWRRAKAGRCLSAEKQPVALGAYARGEQERTFEVLKQSAPSGARIETCAEFTFDQNAKRDGHEACGR